MAPTTISPPDRPQPGDMAPDFSLPTDTEGTITLSQFRGSSVAIFFYPKDDTSGCTKEAIGFTDAKPQFDAANTKLIGISVDSVKKHAKFREKHGLKIALAADEDKAVVAAYGVWVEKSMYGRKYMGIERSTFLIDGSGQVVKTWAKVKVPGHVDEVLAAAHDLLTAG